MSHYRCRFDANWDRNIDMIKFRFRHKAPQGWKKYYLLVPFIFQQAILFAYTATGLETSVEKRVGA